MRLVVMMNQSQQSLIFRRLQVSVELKNHGCRNHMAEEMLRASDRRISVMSGYCGASN